MVRCHNFNFRRDWDVRWTLKKGFQEKQVTLAVNISPFSEAEYCGCSSVRKVELLAHLNCLPGFDFEGCGLSRLSLPAIMKLVRQIKRKTNIPTCPLILVFTSHYWHILQSSLPLHSRTTCLVYPTNIYKDKPNGSWADWHLFISPNTEFFSKDRLSQHPKNADVMAGVKLRLGWTTVK